MQTRKKLRSSDRAEAEEPQQPSTSKVKSSSIPPSSAKESGPEVVIFTEFGAFHRTVLSVVMDRSCLASVDVRDLFRAACAAFQVNFPEEDSAAYYDMVASTVGVINQRLKKYRLAIRKVASGTTLDSYYCLANQSSHELHKEQEIFSATELEFFYELINKIVDAPQCLLDRHEAVGVRPASKQLSSSVAEELLKKYEKLQFVCQEAESGRYTLGPRCLAELEHYIRERNAAVITPCAFCHGPIVSHGVVCEKCTRRCHPACLIRSLSPLQAASQAEEMITCADCREPYSADVVERYRKMGRKICRALEIEAAQRELG